MTSKLLILGASSSVGRRLYSRLGSDSVIGTYRSAPLAGGRRFDSLSMSIKDVVRPGEVSHAAVLLADPQPDSCVKDPETSRRLNVLAMERLIEDLWSLDIVPIFASTEFVFDGTRGNYVETDEARPILLYGRQKKEVEDFLTASGRPHAILRLAKVYGDQPGDGTLFSSWIQQILSGATHLRCAADQAFSPVFVDDVGDAILRVAARGLEGLFHLSGNRRFARVELLERTIAAIRAVRPVEVTVETCSIDDFGLPEPRPKDVSMCADKLARACDLRFTEVETVLTRLLAKVP